MASNSSKRRSEPDIVVNAGSERFNVNPLFVPAAGALCGLRRASSEHSEKVTGHAIGEIPGYQIRLWTGGTPYAQVVDLLKEPENKAVLERMEQRLKGNKINPTVTSIAKNFKRAGCVEPFERELNGIAPNNLATWLFWLRNGIEYHNLILVKGDIPPREKILEMGDVWLCDPNELGLRTKEDYHVLRKRLSAAPPVPEKAAS